GGERLGALDPFGTVLARGSDRSPSCFHWRLHGPDHQRGSASRGAARAPRAVRRRRREVPGAALRHPGGGVESLRARSVRCAADSAPACDRERLGGGRAPRLPAARRRLRERPRPGRRLLQDAARMTVETLRLSAEEANRLVADGEVSSDELYRAYLGAIDERYPELHAFLHVCENDPGEGI